MNYIELSIKSSEEESKKLAENISTTFKPDIVVFIAKGSFIIGYVISKYFNVPLIEIFAVRKGGKIKSIISPIFKYIPKGVKQILRKREMESGIHNKNKDRKVFMDSRYEKLLDNASNILIVDDSVDTGNTALEVYEYVANIANKDNIKFAALNYFDESKDVFKVDYSLYINHMLSGPWSIDSKEHKRFIRMYQEWKSNKVGQVEKAER